MEIDWKKKYNEALEKIKRYATDKYGCTRLKPADIFPELSNDEERIKKAIIDALNSHNNSINVLSSRGYSMDDVISYLEKQKAINEKESFAWTRHDEAVRKEAIACLENWKDAIIRVGGLVDYENILAWLKKELPEKQKERQEVNCDFYNKELSDIVSAELYKYSGSNSIKSPWALDSTGVQYPLYFANLGAKWQKKQKSGEWNGEDERIRNEILEYFLITRARDFVANPKRQKWISYIEKQKESIKEVEPITDGLNTEFQKQVSYLIASSINKEHEYSEGYVKWVSQSLLEYAKKESVKRSDESEDEKIRTFLYEFIKICGWSDKQYPPREKCLAYLEKQKELPFIQDVVLGLPGLYFYDGEKMHFRGNPAMEEKQKECVADSGKTSADSENERIRKVLCIIVDEIPLMDTELRAHGLSKERVLAWLEKQKKTGINWMKSDNRNNPKKPYIDKAGMFYTTDGRMCYASEIEKQKEQAEELSMRLNGLMQEYVKSGKDEEEQEHRLKCYHLFWDALSDSEFFKQKDSPMPEDTVIFQKGVEEGRRLEREDLPYWQTFKGIGIIVPDDYILAKFGKGYKLLRPGDTIEIGTEFLQVSQLDNLPKEEQYKEQKPEWSEEDEKMYARVVRRYTDYEGVIMRTKEESVANKMLNAVAQEEIWLKALTERFNLQPKQEWSEEDKHNLNSVINLVHTTTNGAWGSVIGVQIENWIKNLPERFNLTSKIEWSEEDNIGWDEAFACVTRAEKAAKNEEELQNAVTAKKWLKEIKFKYYVHPTEPEWSEENEKMKNECIRILSENCAGNSIYITRAVDWLKSLRPQPHWKPSEEQIKILEKAVAFFKTERTGTKIKEVLESLYEQLKKLM